MVFKDPNTSKKSLTRLLIAPALVMLSVFSFLLYNNALSPNAYLEIQKNEFFRLNSLLSSLGTIQLNTTQLGDALITLSLLSPLVVFFPKVWENLLSSSVISLFVSLGLKGYFDIARPITYWGEKNINVIGKEHIGYSSFPSGHSITTFTYLTVIMLAFMPSRLLYRVLWILFITLLGLFIASSRIGVGAHHPIDVICGCSFGYLCGVFGTYLSQKYNIMRWSIHKKALPFLCVVFLGALLAISHRITKDNLIVYYFPLISLSITIYAISKKYIQTTPRDKSK